MKTFLRTAFSFAFLAAAAVSASAADLGALYKKAEEAFASRDAARTDFYAARYLAFAAADPASGKGAADVDRLYAARPLVPTAFLSASYDPAFIDWFEKAMLPLWAAPESAVREKHGSVEVRNVREGRYFAAVTAYPKIEAWFTADDTHAGSRRLLMALGSSAKGRRATLIAGRYVEGSRLVPFRPVELNSQSHALQYVWKPSFEDLDGDGAPELWVRYNLTWGNGFTQFLDVYRLGDKQLTLIRRFEGPNEGFARRTASGTVETAVGRGSKGGLSHFDYDSHRIETWEWKDAAFVKAGERDVPHLLRGSGWKDVFDTL